MLIGDSGTTFHYGSSGELIRVERQNGESSWYGPGWHVASDGTTWEVLPGIGYLVDGDLVWALESPNGMTLEGVDQASGSSRFSRELGTYGLPLVESGQVPAEIGLDGIPFDPASQLHLTPKRAFDARDGQWLQPEPLLTSMPGVLSLDTPQLWSAYRYSGNSPFNLSDPSGLSVDTSTPSLDEERPPSFKIGFVAPPSSGGLIQAGIGAAVGAYLLVRVLLSVREHPMSSGPGHPN